MKAKPWTKEQDEQLTQLYPTTKAKVIAKILERNLAAVYQRAFALGIKSNCNSGSKVPIGYERMDKDRGQLLRKVADTGDKKTDWRRVDVIQWEELHGPVPDGLLLMIADQTLPRGPDNLVLVSKSNQFKMIRGEPDGMPIGSESFRHGIRIRKIKNTGDRKLDWKRVDVIEWEAINGPVPPGHKLRIINPMLPRTLDNVRPMTQLEYWASVRVDLMPPEMRDLYALKLKINRQLKTMGKDQSRAPSS